VQIDTITEALLKMGEKSLVVQGQGSVWRTLMQRIA
jgi:hypothetical protein